MTDFKGSLGILSVEQLWTLQAAEWHYRKRNLKETLPLYLRNIFVPQQTADYKMRSHNSAFKSVHKSVVIINDLKFRLAESHVAL